MRIKLINTILVLFITTACSDYSGNENDVGSSLEPEPVAATPGECDGSTAPTVAEVTAVSTASDTTPDYTFSTSQAGTITYAGSCSSSTTTASVGNNTITFNELSEADYSNCKILVTNSCSLASDNLSVSSFTINLCDTSDTTKPALSETTRIGSTTDNKTNDSTPSYIFSSSEEGTITYGGSCSSSTTSTAAGDKTITFSSLAVGTYSDCTIQVTDCNSNISDNLSVSPFEYYRRPLK